MYEFVKLSVVLVYCIQFPFDFRKMYICYYYSAVFERFEDIIEHLIKKHESKCLKYRVKELNCETGNIGYRTKIFEGIIPKECTLNVTSNNVNSFSNRKQFSNIKRRSFYRKTTTNYRKKYGPL